MANKYIDSAATGGSNNGTDWANAYLTFADAAAADSAGDVFYVKNTHSESTASSIALAWAGTASAPTRLISVSDSNEPPTTFAAGASVATTGASNITIVQGSGYVYYYGIHFIAGDSTNSADIICGASGTVVTLRQCTLELRGSGGAGDIQLCANSAAAGSFNNCEFKFSNAAQGLKFNGLAELNGGSITGTSTSHMCTLYSSGAVVRICGFDVSNMSSSGNIINSTMSFGDFYISNSKLPASWSGNLNGSTLSQRAISVLSNCDSSDTNFRYIKSTPNGSIYSETTLVRTGGATDGTNALSWKMQSGTDAEWSHRTLDSGEIVRWNETTGSSITTTVEILHDSATNLTDKEIWIEVQYLGTSGYPLGSFVNDAAATYLTSAADQTTSSETWTTTGMSNPNKQKLSVTFTPQEKGYIHAVVKLAKASYTVYVDPMLTVS